MMQILKYNITVLFKCDSRNEQTMNELVVGGNILLLYFTSIHLCGGFTFVLYTGVYFF